jgi:hypothetical protein
MKPEEQRIAIAEACGWITSKNGTEGFAPRDRKINILCDIYDPLPQYHSDLNAMHEAVETLRGLDGPQWFDFQRTLMIECGSWMNCIQATAAQRAEAFLRTLNLWKP